MNIEAAIRAADRRAPIPFAEFVALTAALMAMGAIGTDAMLPALPAIGRALRVAEGNRRQFVISAYVLGLGFGQLIHGPLSDRFGRRPVMVASLAGYAATNIACAAAASFTLLLIVRALGGVVIAASRVVTVAIVRDCYEGRAMARVLSTAFIVFMLVPILAPTFGTAVLLVGDWRAIFAAIAGLAVLVAIWFAARMPETQHVEDRLKLSPGRVAAGWRLALTDRLSLGYSVASGAVTGGMYGYLNSIQQVVGDAFGRPRLLTVVFAATAGAIAVANLINARLVMRFGQRLLSHGATCLLVVVSGLHLLVYAGGEEGLATFCVLQGLSMACFGLIGANFSTMAMQNMGHIAGTASSVQGFVSILIGSLIGAAIGQEFDGTARPMIAGFLLVGLAGLALAALTERGRLFRPA